MPPPPPPPTTTTTRALDKSAAAWLLQNPLPFIEEALGQRLRWPTTGKPDLDRQAMVEAARQGKHIFAVGGHRTGKDYTAACIDAWEMLAMPCEVVLLAPKEDQAKEIQLYYLKKILREAPGFASYLWKDHAESVTIRPTGSRALVRAAPSTGSDPRRRAMLTGTHRERLRIHITEASSIPNMIWEQIVTLMGSPDVRVTITMNAIPSPGHWAMRLWERIQRGEESRDHWAAFQFSSLASPYVTEDWIDSRRREWGEGSVLWQMRVLGEFPKDGELLLFPLSLLQESADLAFAPTDQITDIGVDVAGPGTASDQTVIQCLRGRVADPPEALSGARQEEIAARVIRLMEVNGLTRQPHRVKIDATGLGIGVVQRIQEEGYPVVGVNFARRANLHEEFSNARAEMYLNLLGRLNRRELKLPNDEFLFRDLTEIRLVPETPRKQIVEKEEIKARLGWSPDRSDALALACYGAPLQLDDDPRARGLGGGPYPQVREPGSVVRLRGRRLIVESIQRARRDALARFDRAQKGAAQGEGKGQGQGHRNLPKWMYR